MDDTRIMEMLKELVEEIDYDIYKELFVYDGADEEHADHIESLIGIVKKHFSQGGES